MELLTNLYRQGCLLINAGLKIIMFTALCGRDFDFVIVLTFVSVACNYLRIIKLSTYCVNLLYSN